MRSSTRGIRRLLVLTGAMTLGVSAVAPTMALAAGHGGHGDGPDHGAPTDVAEGWVWLCAPTPSVEHPWELIRVNVSASAGQVPRGASLADVSALAEAAEEAGVALDDAALNQLGDLEEQLLDAGCGALPSPGNGSSPGGTGGGGSGAGSVGSDAGDGSGDGSEGSEGDGSGGGSVGSDAGGGSGGGSVGSGAGGGNPQGSGSGGGSPASGGVDPQVPGGAGGVPAGGVPGGVVPPVRAGSGGSPLVVVPVAPGAPAVTPGSAVTPAPAPEDQTGSARPPKPVVISHDQVSAPVPGPAGGLPVTADAPAPEASGDSEVLGVRTTRTPTGAASVVRTLPRTGSDQTQGVAVAGAALLLAGLALEAMGRRRSARVGGQPSA